MINEKMLELLCLSELIKYSLPNNIDRDKLFDRYKELRAEFLYPYVIDIAEKSD